MYKSKYLEKIKGFKNPPDSEGLEQPVRIVTQATEDANKAEVVFLKQESHPNNTISSVSPAYFSCYPMRY